MEKNVGFKYPVKAPIGSLSSGILAWGDLAQYQPIVVDGHLGDLVVTDLVEDGDWLFDSDAIEDTAVDALCCHDISFAYVVEMMKLHPLTRIRLQHLPQRRLPLADLKAGLFARCRGALHDRVVIVRERLLQVARIESAGCSLDDLKGCHGDFHLGWPTAHTTLRSSPRRGGSRWRLPPGPRLWE